MAQLDRFLSALTEYKAEALVLEEDAPPAFRFLSGTKPVSQQVLDLSKIAGLIDELTSNEAMKAFEDEGTASFVYNMGQNSYTGILENDSGKVVATLWETTEAMAQAQDETDSATDGPGAGSSPEGESGGSGERENAVGNSDGSAGASVDDASKVAAAVKATAAGAPAVNPTPLPDFGVNSMAEAIPNDLPAEIRAGLDELLHVMVGQGASDLHLSSGNLPTMRIDGSIMPMEGFGSMAPEEMIRMLFCITPRRNREQFMETRDTDFAYSIEGLSRFRVNMFYDREGPGAVFRAIPNEIVPAERLGLPPVVRDLAMLNKGLVLVTGPTGCGKSTTLAAILDIVNSTRDEHIITIEDPIEFVHPHKKCLVNQRQVGIHTGGFKPALRAALREDPDVVLVGEMRDLETVEMAIETAETGHLVFATLHTTTAPSTVDRLIDQFPADRQSQIRTMLSDSLKAVIAQTLCKQIGGGRVAALEILLGNPSVANLIREGKTHQIENSMQTGRKLGMQTLNDHLLQLVKNKVVDPREAYLKSTDKTGIMEALGRQGIDIDL